MIEVRDLHFSFERKKVLKGINLEIYDGECFVVLGKSGCGKTVFLKNLLRLLVPDRGEIIIDGVDITKLDRDGIYEVREKFGMVFQSAALFDSLTVWENVGLGLLEHTSLTPEEVREIAIEKLGLVGLKGVEDLKPASLSGGMKKRVGIARAIARDPKYLLYDEPTTGLDPVTAGKINDLIAYLNDELKVTTVIVTHDLASTYKLADRIALLDDGVIVEQGNPREFWGSEDPRVREFVESYPVPLKGGKRK